MEENNQNKEITNDTNNFEEVAVYQEVETKKKEVRTDSYFDGGVLELIGWRILAFLITAVTLGIATPWAKCMLYSWQIKHTIYNGKRLKFEGTGGDLFVNMFKWLFFTIITLGIYALFIPIRKTRWVISNIHFEDEEYVKEESFFDGKTLQLIGINILSKIITIFSLGLLYPFAICLKLKWINKHTIINRKKLVFDGNGLQLWGKYLLWYILTIITFGIFSIWMPILMLKWKTKHIHIKKVGEEEKKDKSMFIIIPIAIILIIAIISLIFGIVIPKIKDGNFEVPFKNIVQTIGIRETYSPPEQNEIFLDIYSKYIWDEISWEECQRQMELNNIEMNNITDETREKLEQIKQEKWRQNSNSTLVEEPKKTMTPETNTQIPTPAKTSIIVGGYTLKFGTYTGTLVQGVWDDTTMTSTEERTKVTLKLTENNITINGESGSYSTSGTKIIWKGQDYILEVSGNNKIKYNAENCPDLIYQGN